MYGVLGCGWTIMVYVLQLLWENLRTIFSSYKSYVMWYTIVTGIISFIRKWAVIEFSRVTRLYLSYQIFSVLQMGAGGKPANEEPNKVDPPTLGACSDLLQQPLRRSGHRSDRLVINHVQSAEKVGGGAQNLLVHKICAFCSFICIGCFLGRKNFPRNWKRWQTTSITSRAWGRPLRRWNRCASTVRAPSATSGRRRWNLRT